MPWNDVPLSKLTRTEWKGWCAKDGKRYEGSLTNTYKMCQEIHTRTT